MIITCKECKTNFNLDEILLEKNGSKVRCSICKDIFFAYPPASAKMPDTSPDIPTGDKIPEDVNSSQENLQSLYNDDLSNDIDVPTAAFDTEIETDLKHEDLPVNTEPLISDNAIASKIFVEENEPSKLSLNLDINLGESLLEEQSEVPEDIDLALDMDIENPLQDEQEELSMDIDLESNDTTQETIEDGVKTVEEAIVEEPAELSLDIDIDLDMDAEKNATLNKTPEDIDLALDMDIENPLQDEPDEIAIKPDELSMDIDLESNDTIQETIEDEVKAVEEAIVEEPAEFSLDLDFDLDMDAEKNATPDETPKDIDLELDMDIENPLQDEPDELLMEIDLESSDITGDKTDENSEEIELELELETDEQLDANDTTEKKIETPDEIDLSAIENMLDLDDGVELDESKDNKIKEITLELDTEVEEKTFPDASENELELEEVDLADLENMLGVKEETDDVIDLLDSTEKDLKEDDEQHIDATQTLDLTEIETMLDLDDSQNQNMDSENLTEEIELELDNDIKEEQDKDQKTDESFEKTGEFDISELESMLEITESDIEEDIEEEQESDYHKKSNTIELEFDLDESDKADLYKNYTPDLEADAKKDETDAAEAINEDAEVTSEQNLEIEANTDITNTEKSIKKSGKKKINKLVAGLLIFALMGGGGYGAYTLIKNKNIEIPAIIKKVADLPYVNNFFKDKKEDTTGAIKITPLENSITGKSFTNAKAGELFVIKGKIRNDYNHPRSFIRVKANIFLKGGVRSKTRIVYCGNILSNLDIENLEFDLIKKRLLNRNGDRKSNVNLKPGATLPFMVIFSDLPDNMNMFNVEIESSTP